MAATYPYRIAIIDLGTNSARFDIHEVSSASTTQLLHRTSSAVYLGENLFLEGTLAPIAVERTVDAFCSFKATAQSYSVEQFVAFGTCALREASDSTALTERIRHTCDIDIQIITEQQETDLIALGVLSSLGSQEGRFALLDIGGGSIGLNLCDAATVLIGASLPLGVARLNQVFLHKSPPTGGVAAVSKLRTHVQDVLATQLALDDWTGVQSVVGSSATARVLTQIGCVHQGPKCTGLAEIERCIEMMLPLDQPALKALPGIDPSRTDFILAGAILVAEVMRTLGAQLLYSTDLSMRDGMLRAAISKPLGSI